MTTFRFCLKAVIADALHVFKDSIKMHKLRCLILTIFFNLLLNPSNTLFIRPDPSLVTLYTSHIIYG